MNDNLLADIIIEQLGYNKFVAMTGAKFTPTYNGVSVHLPRSAKDGIKKININYTHDLYEVIFLRLRGKKEVAVKEFKDVFSFQLLKLIENHTGLKTSL